MSSLTASLAAERRAPIDTRAAAAGIGLAFVAGAAVAASAGSGGGALHAPGFSSLARGAVVVGWACAGLYTWKRRPDSRLGLLIAGAALIYAAASPAAYPDAATHAIGRLVLAGFLVYLAYVLLCFPYDRLGSGTDRRVVRVFGVTSLALWIPAILFLRQLPAGGALSECGARAGQQPPGRDAARRRREGVRRRDRRRHRGRARRGRRGDRAARRSRNRLARAPLEPVLAAAILLDVSYIAFSSLHQAGVSGAGHLRYVAAVAALAIPSSLIAGQVRGRTMAASRLTRLVAGAGTEPLTPAAAQGRLRDALGDPTLECCSGRRSARSTSTSTAAVRAAGRPARRGVTMVGGHESLTAALVHDPSPSFDDGSGAVEGLALTTLLLLDRKLLVDDCARRAPGSRSPRRRTTCASSTTSTTACSSGSSPSRCGQPRRGSARRRSSPRGSRRSRTTRSPPSRTFA